MRSSEEMSEIIIKGNYYSILTLYSQVKDLERSLSSTSAKLSDRNREYGALQLDNEQQKVHTYRYTADVQTIRAI